MPIMISTILNLMLLDSYPYTKFDNSSKILAMTVSVAVSSGTIKKKDLKSVTVDTTVMPKNIAYPTDSKLLERSRERLVKLAKKYGIKLRQNYNRVCKKLTRQIGGIFACKADEESIKVDQKA